VNGSKIPKVIVFSRCSEGGGRILSPASHKHEIPGILRVALFVILRNPQTQYGIAFLGWWWWW